MIQETLTAKGIIGFSAAEKFCHLQEHLLILNYVYAYFHVCERVHETVG